MMRLSEACIRLEFNIHVIRCCIAMSHPSRCASCDHILHCHATNQAFLSQRKETCLTRRWFLCFYINLQLKLSARGVTWMKSREQPILYMLASYRSSCPYDGIGFILLQLLIWSYWLYIVSVAPMTVLMVLFSGCVCVAPRYFFLSCSTSPSSH